MIIKPFTKSTEGFSNTSFGNKNEADVAFHLNRKFADVNDIFVFNDLLITHESMSAQIDHLLVYKDGFIIIESKSIHGEVSVNDHGEWSRSINGKWIGIKSPLRQAQLQEDILKEALLERVSEFLGKILFKQKTGIKNWRYNRICAVSNSAIIHRKSIPDDQNAMIVKADTIGEKVTDIIEKNRFQASQFIQLSNKVPPVRFNQNELEALVEVIKRIDVSNTSKLAFHFESGKEDSIKKLACPSCSREKTEISYGRFGYFLKCTTCLKNTSLKNTALHCEKCNASTLKISKRKDNFYMICEHCNEATYVHSNR